MPRHTYHFDQTGNVSPDDLLDSTRSAIEKYNSNYKADKAGYFDNLERAIKNFPMYSPHLHIRSEGDSREDVVFLHGPWATPVKPLSTSSQMAELVLNHEQYRPKNLDSNSWSRLIMTDLLHTILREAEVTDKNGDYLSVIAVPSPSLNRRRIGGDWSEAKIRKPMNRLKALGNYALELCDKKHFAKLHLGGVSLGSAVVAEMVLSEYGDYFDINSLYHSETPNFIDRNPIDFAKRYFTDAATDWQLAGPLPRQEIARGKEFYDWKNVYGNGNLYMNLRLALDMRKGRLDAVIKKAAKRNIPTTIEYGDLSKVSEGMEEFIGGNEIAEARLAANGLLILKATGFAPHSHTENLIGAADGLARAVIFGNRPRKN